MRLCFMIYSLSAGGAERVISQLANHYAEKGAHDVHVMTLQPEGTKSFYHLNSNITLHQLGLHQTGGALGKVKRVLCRLLSMRRAIKKLKPQKIISFVDEMNTAVLLATLGLNQHVIISERIDPRYYSIGMVGNILRRILYPLSKILVVQGAYIASYFPYMNRKISIIPNVISKSLTCVIPSQQLPIIMNVGRLTRQKDQPVLIKAFSKLVHKYPSWSLDIYGEGPDKGNLEALIKELSLEEKVFLKGLASPIQEKLSKASIFVFPSLFEGFPNALGEAMSVGLPVIASDCGGNLELVQPQENGLVFPAQDEEKLVEHLDDLMGNPDKRAVLGAKAKESIARFSPAEIYKKWDDVIEEKS